MRKWLKLIATGIGVAVLAVAALIGIAVVDLWYENNYKSEIQTIELPSLNRQFILLTDIAGFGDPAWYVYQLPIGSEPTKQMRSGNDTEGVLFWNYSEAGDHSKNPKIEVVNDRYLVFSRGGFYHSVYDLQMEAVLVNDESPWNSFQKSGQHRKYGEEPPPGAAGTAMDVWVRENLHSRIERILDGAT